MESALNITNQETLCGKYGRSFATPSHLTPTSVPPQTPYQSCSYLPTDIEMVMWLPVTMKSVLEWWKIPFMPWAGVLHIGPS